MVSNDVPNDGDSDDAAPTSNPSNRAGWSEQRGDVTEILSAIEQGDGQGAERLLPLIYGELRRLAAVKMAGESPGNTLQPTALVHEAYIRLVDVDQAQHWNSRGHFFGAAAEAMRRILVESARRKSGPEAGGGLQRMDMSHVDPEIQQPSLDLLAMDELLSKFEAQDPRAANLVKLRFFAGLTRQQAAETLGVSCRTADTDWAYAKCWLQLELSGPTGTESHI